MQLLQVTTCVRAGYLFGDVKMPRTTCNPLNRTTAIAHPDSESPYDVVRYTRAAMVLPFLLREDHHRKRRRKLDPKGAAWFLLGPAPNHPQGTTRVHDEQSCGRDAVADVPIYSREVRGERGNGRFECLPGIGYKATRGRWCFIDNDGAGSRRDGAGCWWTCRRCGTVGKSSSRPDEAEAGGGDTGEGSDSDEDSHRGATGEEGSSQGLRARGIAQSANSCGGATSSHSSPPEPVSSLLRGRAGGRGVQSSVDSTIVEDRRDQAPENSPAASPAMESMATRTAKNRHATHNQGL